MARFLFLSYLYPPDLGPGPSRASRLVRSFAEFAAPEDELVVLVGSPTRSKTGNTDLVPSLGPDRVKVVRFFVPNLGRGLFGQAASYTIYFFSVVVSRRLGKADAVIATSSRLFTAVLGALLSWTRRVAFHLDLRDLFSDVFSDFFGSSRLGKLSGTFQRLERKVIRRADQVSVVSPGFVEYVRERNQKARIFVSYHGSDVRKPVTPKAREPVGRVRVLYAGNVGDAQNLDFLIPQSAKQTTTFADFVVVGTGSRLEHLRTEIVRVGALNVSLHPPCSRTDLDRYYSEADVLLVTVKASASMERVIPSKLFEYATTSLPILAGVGRTARDFASQNIPGVIFFDPGSPQSLAEAIQVAGQMVLPQDRSDFTRSFSVAEENRKFWDHAIRLAKSF